MSDEQIERLEGMIIDLQNKVSDLEHQKMMALENRISDVEGRAGTLESTVRDLEHKVNYG